MNRHFEKCFFLLISSTLLSGCNFSFSNRSKYNDVKLWDRLEEPDYTSSVIGKSAQLEEFPDVIFRNERSSGKNGLFANDRKISTLALYLYASDLNGDGYRELLFGNDPNTLRYIGVYDCHNDKIYLPFIDCAPNTYKFTLNDDGKLVVLESLSVNWSYTTRIGLISLKNEEIELTWHDGQYKDFDEKLFVNKPEDVEVDHWVTEKISSSQMVNEGHKQLPILGASLLLDKHYEPVVSDSMTEAPEKHITYELQGYPDVMDNARITRVEITDPDIRAFGLTCKSSKEEIFEKMRPYSYKEYISDTDAFLDINYFVEGKYNLIFRKYKSVQNGQDTITASVGSSNVLNVIID